MAFFIPEPVVKRLPMYYRYLREMERENKTFVSSAELGEAMGLTASQVRQDVSAFGGEGRQGCGYPVAEMCQHIGKVLGKNTPRTMAIIGMGNLGRAIVRYDAFVHNSFAAVAAFDSNPQKVGLRIGSFTIQSIDELEAALARQPVDVAVLTLPAASAQSVAERLYQCGIRGFWNFAPVDLHLPKDAAIVSVHLDESLELLSYRLAHSSEL